MILRLTVPFVLSVLLSGCGQRSSKPSGEAGEDKKEAIAGMPTLAVHSDSAAHPAGSDRLLQSFKEATRKEPPPDARPPEKTMTGKSVGVLYEEVVRQW